MNKRITSYQTLLEEQQRLHDLLHDHKLQIMEDIKELKEEIKPVMRVVSFLGKLAIPNVTTNSALNIGTGVALEWILKRLIGSSNPLLRFVIPAIARNYSSHYLPKAIPFLQKLKDKIFSRNGKN
jgi:hypothetical protein